MSNNIITHLHKKGEVSLPIVSFVHNFEVNFISQKIKQEFDVLTKFLDFIVVNFNPRFEVLNIIRERQKGFGTGHKEPVDLHRWSTFEVSNIISFYVSDVS